MDLNSFIFNIEVGKNGDVILNFDPNYYQHGGVRQFLITFQKPLNAEYMIGILTSAMTYHPTVKNFHSAGKHDWYVENTLWGCSDLPELKPVDDRFVRLLHSYLPRETKIYCLKEI